MTEDSCWLDTGGSCWLQTRVRKAELHKFLVVNQMGFKAELTVVCRLVDYADDGVKKRANPLVCRIVHVCLGMSGIDAIPSLVDWSVGGVDVSGGTLQTFQQPARIGLDQTGRWTGVAKSMFFFWFL